MSLSRKKITKSSKKNDSQSIYGFKTSCDGSAPETSRNVYEDKKALQELVTTKDWVIKGSTFENTMHNNFIEVPDNKNKKNITRLDIFEMKFIKRKEK
jgi:hypothetical protein